MLSFTNYVETRDLFNEVGAYGAMTDIGDVKVDADQVFFQSIKVLNAQYDPKNKSAILSLDMDSLFGPAQNTYSPDSSGMMQRDTTVDGVYIKKFGPNADAIGIILKCIYAYLVQVKPNILEFGKIRSQIMHKFSKDLGSHNPSDMGSQMTTGSPQSDKQATLKARVNKLFDAGARQMAAAASQALKTDYGVTAADHIVNERGMQSLSDRVGTSASLMPQHLEPAGSGQTGEIQQAIVDKHFADRRDALKIANNRFSNLFKRRNNA